MKAPTVLAHLTFLLTIGISFCSDYQNNVQIDNLPFPIPLKSDVSSIRISATQISSTPVDIGIFILNCDHLPSSSNLFSLSDDLYLFKRIFQTFPSEIITLSYPGRTDSTCIALQTTQASDLTILHLEFTYIGHGPFIAGCIVIGVCVLQGAGIVFGMYHIMRKPKSPKKAYASIGSPELGDSMLTQMPTLFGEGMDAQRPPPGMPRKGPAVVSSPQAGESSVSSTPEKSLQQSSRQDLGDRYSALNDSPDVVAPKRASAVLSVSFLSKSPAPLSAQLLD